MSVTRLYISPIILKSEMTEDNILDEYQTTKAADLAEDHRTSQIMKSIDSGPNRGKPEFTWSLVKVVTPSAAGQQPLRDDPELISLPKRKLSEDMTHMTGGEFNTLKTAIEAKGVNMLGINRNDLFRKLLIRVARHLEPAFDIEKLRSWKQDIG